MRMLLISLLFVSCSASHHVRQAERHISKAIAKGHEYQADTVYIQDTLYIESVQADTVFHVDVDSIIIEKDRLRIRYIRRVDSVYIDGECEADTLIKEVPVRVDRAVIKEPTLWAMLRKFGLWILLAIFVLAYLLARSGR